MSHWTSSLENVLSLLIQPLEWVMLLAVLGGGFFLFFHSRGVPLLKFKMAFQLLFQKEKNKGISRFQALSAVLAATVGLGNISGVAIAIHMGGPGVLVWMWLTALIGMVIKFYSCTLAVQLRQFENNGEPLGGPMYYMEMGIKKWGKPLAVWFSIAGLFGVLPRLQQINSPRPLLTLSNLTRSFYWVLFSGNSSWGSFYPSPVLLLFLED